MNPRRITRSIEADWPRKLREESPVEVRVNVIRIGDTVICTNPAELFSDFALAIRGLPRAGRADQPVDRRLRRLHADPEAFTRGGYETWPSGTSKLVPEAGTIISKAQQTFSLPSEGRVGVGSGLPPL